MKKSYRTLEFSFIQDYIKNYCFSEMAKKRIDQIQPFQDIDDLKLYQDDISSAMKIIYAYGRIPLAPYEDIKEILQKAQKGGVCYPQDLLKIVQILKNVQEVQEVTAEQEQYINDFKKELPMEYAVELNRLLKNI